MRWILCLLLTFNAARSEDVLCKQRVENASMRASEVVEGLENTLAKSKEFLRMVATTLLEFDNFELEIQEKAKQLEQQCSQQPIKACDCAKESENGNGTETSETSAAGNAASSSEETTTDEHKPKTTRTSWTGPANACARLYNNHNKTLYAEIKNYPNNVAGVLVLEKLKKKTKDFEDQVVKVDVRDGCMATLYEHHLTSDKWLGVGGFTEKKTLKNVEYGTYEVKSVVTGTAEDGWEFNGVSRMECMCDPVRTKHKKLTAKDSVRHHLWNEQTQQAEWNLPDNLCGEMYQGILPTRLRIPNWPLNKRYDVNLVQAGFKSPETISSVAVRNGCFATMYKSGEINSKKTLETVGYGVHKVAKGTTRVVCECLNDDSGNEEFRVATPKAPECIDFHAFNKETGKCEWISENPNECAALISKDQSVQLIANLKAPMPQILTENSRIVGKHVVKAVVRQGCMATLWSAPLHTNFTLQSENKLLANVEYGEYEVESSVTGTAAGGNADNGLDLLTCYCDPTQINNERTPESDECLPGHSYDEKHGHCEWQEEKNICGEVENDKGEKLPLRIPNWPLNKRYDVNLEQAKHTPFHGKISSIMVRQHCVATLYSGAELTSLQNLSPSGYGNYSINEEETRPTTRVVCECMY